MSRWDQFDCREQNFPLFIEAYVLPIQNFSGNLLRCPNKADPRDKD